jgi:hypothetical protein
MRVEKALTTCIVYQKLFYFFEQQMPPVLSASFYEPHPPSIQKLAVSSWFATRSCLLDLRMPLVKDMPSSRNDDDAKPSSTSQAELQRWECCTFCKSLKDSLPGYCSMLQCVGETLSRWMAPKEFNPAEDQIKSATEFIESPEVINQFSVNFTLRQQWLAIALATLLKV